MQNFIGFVNEQLRWEPESPHRHDCHDPPHAARVGIHDHIPQCEDCLRLQGPTLGKQHLRGWHCRESRLGVEKCLGLWGVVELERIASAPRIQKTERCAA